MASKLMSQAVAHDDLCARRQHGNDRVLARRARPQMHSLGGDPDAVLGLRRLVQTSRQGEQASTG